ncbi:MAG: radical SAM protein [Candidatus Nealsonbacteria bacterium]|nr:radical SAM protein [Candidatus Nealsonbacteria bacterium]
MENLEKIKSICPECFKNGKTIKIEAEIIEDEGKIWITKSCPQHGSFKDVMFSDPQLYYKWMKYKKEGHGVENVEIKSSIFPDTRLYPKHKSQTILTNLLVTNRCNLRCGYCFMNAGVAGYIYEPSLEQLKKMMEEVIKEKPVPSKAIQITGGEPTIREDLFEIIRTAREVGFSHVQLNTNGIKLAESVDYCRKVKEAGVNTIYISFDGVSKKTNPWIEQNKKAIENLRQVGITSIILVPVVMRRNLHELGLIVKFAAENIDVIRGVNFQPIAFAGKSQNISEDQRKKERVDYAEMIAILEEELEGQVKKEDFYPVPFVFPISELNESITGKKQVEFTANPMCGAATYVAVENGKLIPITRYVDVEGLMNFISEQSKTTGLFRKVRIGISLLRNISKYIDKKKAPKGFKLSKLLFKTVMGGTYKSLKEFQYKNIYIGSMWFQDIWNMNLERLESCVIHYTTEEGIIPFCAYNSLGLGEKIRAKHSMSIKEWEQKTGKKMKDDLWKKTNKK